MSSRRFIRTFPRLLALSLSSASAASCAHAPAEPAGIVSTVLAYDFPLNYRLSRPEASFHNFVIPITERTIPVRIHCTITASRGDVTLSLKTYNPDKCSFIDKVPICVVSTNSMTCDIRELRRYYVSVSLPLDSFEADFALNCQSIPLSEPQAAPASTPAGAGQSPGAPRGVSSPGAVVAPARPSAAPPHPAAVPPPVPPRSATGSPTSSAAPAPPVPTKHSAAGARQEVRIDRHHRTADGQEWVLFVQKLADCPAGASGQIALDPPIKVKFLGSSGDMCKLQTVGGQEPAYDQEKSYKLIVGAK